MESESERVYDRMSLYYEMEENPDWSNRHLAKELGRSEKWVRKWRKRIRDAKDVSIRTFLSQSRAPKSCARPIESVVKEVIGGLREELSEKFHRKAGANAILYELQKREDLKEGEHFVPKSKTTITKILKELGYVQKPKPRFKLPIVLPAPNEEWEMDFGEIHFEDEMQLEFFLVVDRGTSRVVYIEGSMGYDAETALEAVARLLLAHGLPKRLRFDRDSRFVGAWTADSYPSALVRFLRVLGVEPVVCPPRRPDKKPFVERSIHTLQHEWLARFAPATYADAIEVLPGYQHYINNERPHQGQACHNRIPNEVFPNLSPLPKVPDTVDPDAWLKSQHGRVYRRRINSSGTIQIDRHTYYIDGDYARQSVLVHIDAHNQAFFVSMDDKVLKRLDMRGLHYNEMDFPTYLLLMKQEARSIERHRQMMWQQKGEMD